MIGARGHSYYVLNDLPKLKNVELCAVSSGDENPSSLLNKAKQWNPRGYADWREMLDREQPDVLSVDGPFELHAEMCIEALKRNIHVICEKPIALQLDELDAIEKICAETSAKIISMVGIRYDAAFWTARKLVKEGAIGKIKVIHTQKSYKLGKRPDFYKSRELYGGTIPWVGSHAIDWLLWFTESEFESVTAFHDHDDNFDNGTMEIAGECLFRMKNGVIATSSIDYLRPATAPTHGDDRIRCAGTKGVIEVMGGKVHLITADGDEYIEPVNPPQSLFEDFIGGLRGLNPLPVTTEETIALTRACLLARESADKHTTEYFS